MREASGLYIHIPFCFSRCGYCAFYSTADASASLIDTYSHVLIEELELHAEKRTSPYTTVYIGGGNPGMLSPDTLMQIADIVSIPGKVEEFTIEMNPESLTKEMFSVFDHGINRLSVGIQTLNEKHLATLERSASLEATLSALHLMKRLSDERHVELSADLMTCIPFQSIADSISDIEYLTDNLPLNHISLYNLTWEEGTRLVQKRNQGTLAPYDEEKERDILFALWNHLSEKGFQQYEISNFSRTGETRSKHNQLYWSDGRYEAVGPSAVGVIEKNGTVIRTTGIAHVVEYVSKPTDTRYHEQPLSTQERLEEYLISSLRTTDGIDIPYMEKTFDVSFADVFTDAVIFLDSHLPHHAHYKNDRYSLTQEGLMMCDSITRLFLEQLP